MKLNNKETLGRVDKGKSHILSEATTSGNASCEGSTPSAPNLLTPRTDDQATEGGRMCDVAVVTAAFSRQLETELNNSQAAIVDAIVNILERGGDERWPIMKRLRAALPSQVVDVLKHGEPTGWPVREFMEQAAGSDGNAPGKHFGPD